MLHLGQNIKLIRGLLGKTQPEFAKLIGLKLSNLKTYENTSVRPKVHIRKRIAAIAGVSVADLLQKDLTENDITLKDEKDEKVKLEASKSPKAGNFGAATVAEAGSEIVEPQKTEPGEKRTGDEHLIIISQLSRTTVEQAVAIRAEAENHKAAIKSFQDQIELIKNSKTRNGVKKNQNGNK